MTTVEDVARHVAGIVNTSEDILLIGDWVSRRWQEIVTHAGGTLRSLRRIGELSMDPPIEAGTVAVTENDKVVIGTGTNFSQEEVGKYIRAKTNWYEIASVESATQLTLRTEYSEPTNGDAGYFIVQRRFELEPAARKLGTFVHMRLRRPLRTVSRDGLDRVIPSRFSVNSVPKWVAEMEPTETGVRRVEIYPFPRQRELISYIYWEEPKKLGFKDQFPGYIDVESLREGVLIDVYRNKMAKAADDGKVEQAALWRNEYRAQETKWEQTHRVRVLSQDVGADDLEFILEREPAHPGRESDRIIDDAFSQIWFT